MNSLIKEVLASGNFGAFQTTALVIFVALMLIVSFWICLPGSKSYYDRIAANIMKGPTDE